MKYEPQLRQLITDAEERRLHARAEALERAAEHFPDLERKQHGMILMACTGFPYTKMANVSQQLERAKEVSGGSYWHAIRFGDDLNYLDLVA